MRLIIYGRQYDLSHPATQGSMHVRCVAEELVYAKKPVYARRYVYRQASYTQTVATRDDMIVL
jgi:hypothetical protein